LSGLGVGLGIARRLIELHGGTLCASSAGVGHGSEFVVTLDTVSGPESAVSGADDPGTAPPPGPEQDGVLADGEGEARRILLVDDNIDFVTSMALLLNMRGHAVRIAHDGASALSAAREHRPEIAFLDIGLPDITGYDLAVRLHALPEAANSVLIAVSGWGQERDRTRSRAAGFAEHLVKPVDIERILATIAAIKPVG